MTRWVMPALGFLMIAGAVAVSLAQDGIRATIGVVLAAALILGLIEVRSAMRIYGPPPPLPPLPHQRTRAWPAPRSDRQATQ